MWKKILIVIPVLAIIIAATVQGTTAKYGVGQEGQVVVLTTDAGVINDHSFNEGSFQGVTKFIKDKYQLEGSEENNYVDAAENSKIGVLNNYKLGVYKGANAIVAPGFSHIDALSDLEATKFLDNISVVLIDAVVNRPNIISVTFNAELSGLQAGFDASFWATRKNDQGKMQGDADGSNSISIGAFGGASSKIAVNNYMFGLFLGMELFNLAIGNDEGNPVKFANSDDGSLARLHPTNATDPMFFTGSFAMGDAVKRLVLPNLVDERYADIIFPVAGPQIQEVISYRAKPGSRSNGGHGNYSPYIVGIDVDETITYPAAAQAGRFVNSAVKNLKQAVYQSLEHAKHLRKENNADGTLGDYNSDVWDGQVVNVASGKASRNWSEATVGGLNLVQEHSLKLYENEAEGKQPFAETNIDKVLKIIMDRFDKAGNDPSDHLDGKFIQSVANQVIDQVKQYMLNTKALIAMNHPMANSESKFVIKSEVE